MTDPIISVDGLTKSFGNDNVFRDVTFEVRRGEIFALLGSNGAGKTTLINILTTLLKADSGSAVVAGHDVAKKANEVRKRISLTGQFAAVDDVLTGRENLELIATLRHVANPSMVSQRLLDKFELTEAGNRRAATYSGGMRRRLDIAMSLIGEPEIVFLDEPTTGLDPQSRNSMWETIEEFARGGTTVFLTTQYLEEADKLANDIAILDRGGIVARGTAAELKAMSAKGRIELRFAAVEQLKSAAALLANYQPTIDEMSCLLVVETDRSVARVAHIFGELDRAQIEVIDFAQRTPTLDDAFLRIISESETANVRNT